MTYSGGCISPADLQDLQAVFDAQSIPHSHMIFFFNTSLSRWEIYDRGADIATSDTLIRKADPGDAEWCAP